MSRKIAVLGSKGGVGKTTITANLCYALAGKSLRIAGVDADTGMNCLGRAFGMPSPLFFLNDVLSGRCRLRQAMMQSENRQCCYVMSVKEYSTPQAQNIRALFTQMEQMFDYIFVDCPPGLGEATEMALKCCDNAIVVFTPHPDSVRGAAKVLEWIKPYEYLKNYVVLNRVRGELIKSGVTPTPFELFNRLHATPLGVVPESDTLAYLEATKNEVFEVMANNLHNGRSDIIDCLKQGGAHSKIKMFGLNA